MISLVLCLSVISLIFAIRSLKKAKQKDDGDGEIGMTFWVIGSLVVLILCFGWEIFATTTLIVRPAQIDEEILMYQEENQKIEASVDAAVASYMEHEEKVFDRASGDDPMTMILLRFPELTSDELVKEQIKIYQGNSKKIKELKKEKIDLPTMKFLVYFGH